MSFKGYNDINANNLKKESVIMNIFKWSELFEDKILLRGKNYYLNGHVHNIDFNKNIISAVVYGTQKYNVKIKLKDNYIDYWSCDCPYAEDATPCKHLAAVLFAVNNSNIDNQDNELKKCIEKMSKKELQIFVYEVAQRNKAIQKRLLLKYSDVNNDTLILQIKADIDCLISKFTAYNDYIDYYHSNLFYNELYDFLDNQIYQIIDDGNIMIAFEALCYSFIQVVNCDIDDSDGIIDDFICNCSDFWEMILEKADEKQQIKIYKWFLDLKKYDLLDYIQDSIFDIQMTIFNSNKFIEENIKFIDENLNSKIDEYRIPYLIMKRLSLMEKLNQSIDVLYEYGEKYLKYNGVLDFFIKKFIDCNDYNKAIYLMEYGKSLGKNKYNQQLIMYYKKTNKLDKLKKELLSSISNYHQYNMDNINMLKNIISNSEWSEILEDLLTSPLIKPIKCELLVQENRLYEFFDEIKNNKSICQIEKWHEVLKEHFARETCKLYIEILIPQMKNLNNRKQYKDLISHLEKLKLFPNGNQNAIYIAEEWKKLYPKRSSMINELNKAGF